MPFRATLRALMALQLATLTVLGVGSAAVAQDYGYLDETYRPQFHYTAEKDMINDPNGLVYVDGKYHLFHQLNIHDAVHWGHAVSTDLVHWQHLPPALAPDGIGQIFSGSVVVDERNSSGLQTGTSKVLVALFTYGEHNNGPQSQGLAYSNDNGSTWKMYSGNPVIPNTGQANFRDPKVFWHQATSRWVMVLTVSTQLEFYTSTDLIHWTYTSSWGAGQGAHGGQWECPDLFEMPIQGTTKKKWVLSVSVDNGAPAGGTGMQYFVGSFDGTTFKNDNAPSTVLWQNYGKDYYAGVTWNNVPPSDGRRLMIAWSDNWKYRFDLPTTPFNGQLSMTRELHLKSFPEGLRLTQAPVAAYTSLRGSATIVPATTMAPDQNLLAGIRSDSAELQATFSMTGTTASEFGVKVRTGPGGQETIVGYNRLTQRMFVDRTHAGVTPNLTGTSPNPYWNEGRQEAPLAPVNGEVKLQIFVDRSSVEVFGNDGREQITDLILPDRSSTGLQTFAVGGAARVVSLTMYPLARAWAAAPTTRATAIPSWSSVSGEWADTNRGREGSADGLGLQLSATNASDFSMSVTGQVLGVVPGNNKPIKKEDAFGLAFRANQSGTEGYVALVSARTQTVSLSALDGTGALVTLATAALPVSTNTQYVLGVTATGDHLVLAVNGEALIDIHDTTYSDGLAGVALRDSAVILTAITLNPSTTFATTLRGWKSVSGTWGRAAGGMRGSSNGDGFLMSGEVAGDLQFGADITIADGAAQRAGTLVIRADDTAGSGYGINIDASADVVTLFRWGSGAVIDRVPVQVDTGRTYRLQVVAIGPQLTVSLDGRTVIDATDDTFSAGKVGLDTYSADATFQNVTLKRIASAWNPTSGSWTTTGPVWQGNSTGDGFLMSAATARDLDLETTLRVSPTDGGGAGGLMFRAGPDARTGYLANLDVLNDCVTLIRFNADGSSTTLGRHVYSMDADRPYHLVVHADGDQLRIDVDGATVLSARDSTYANGQIGLNTWHSQATFTDTSYAPSRNLVTNPGFETGDLRGWSEWHPSGQAPAWGVDGNDAFVGRSKLYFYAPGAFQQSAHQLLSALAPGRYAVSAWVKLNRPATTARLELTQHGSAPIDIALPVGATYHRINATVTVTTSLLDVGFYLDSPGDTSLQVDNVEVRRL